MKIPRLTKPDRHLLTDSQNIDIQPMLCMRTRPRKFSAFSLLKEVLFFLILVFLTLNHIIRRCFPTLRLNKSSFFPMVQYLFKKMTCSCYYVTLLSISTNYVIPSDIVLSSNSIPRSRLISDYKSKARASRLLNEKTNLQE